MECGVKDFIYWNYIKDISLCDRIINHYKNFPNKVKGKIAAGYIPDMKSCTEITLNTNSILLEEYLNQLQVVVDEYIQKFQFCNSCSPWTIIETINIQHYMPNENFKIWHCERSNPTPPYTSRHLVFMTYLNDVNDGGETEWYYQQLKIKPKKGLTVLWPADWTYTHRGVVSSTEEKFIVTGWFNYV